MPYLEEDFINELNKLKEEWDKPFVPKPYVSPVQPKIELTQEQKRFIINYHLGSCSKGIFESPKFWKHLDGTSMTDKEVDDLYPSLRDAADDFVEEIKQHLLVYYEHKTSLQN